MIDYGTSSEDERGQQAVMKSGGLGAYSNENQVMCRLRMNIDR